MMRSLWIALAVAGVLECAAMLRAEEPALRQVIDREVRNAWEREKVAPAPAADDAAFHRRIHLDLVGTIPTADETKRFLADTDTAKRTKLIDRLLDDPRFAEHQANVWDLVLFGRHPGGGDTTRKRDGFKQWLAKKFAANEPYDRWVRELLLGDNDEASLFYVQYRGLPEDTAVAVSRIFLGTQLQCARCHDHPFEKWTQKDFYGVAAFFARVVVIDGGGDANKRKFFVGEKSTGDVLFTGPAAEQKPGKKGEPIKAKYLGGAELDEPALPKDFKEPDIRNAKTAPPKPFFSRKEKVAEWIASKENPYLARAVANRVWAQFMGKGLVHPIDDLSDKKPPSHPALMQALAQQVAAHQFDLKWYIRELANTQTYQLAASGAGTDATPLWFERARIRPLSAEELMASLRVATGFDDAARAAGQKDVKLGGDTIEYMLRYFGEPMNGRGDFQGGLNEHLFLNNSSNIRSFIQPRKGNLADSIMQSKATWDDKVDQMFLAVLNRMPKPEERKRFVAYLTANPKADGLVEEAIWVLVNCSEFRFNH